MKHLRGFYDLVQKRQQRYPFGKIALEGMVTGEIDQLFKRFTKEDEANDKPGQPKVSPTTKKSASVQVTGLQAELQATYGSEEALAGLTFTALPVEASDVAKYLMVGNEMPENLHTTIGTSIGLVRDWNVTAGKAIADYVKSVNAVFTKLRDPEGDDLMAWWNKVMDEAKALSRSFQLPVIPKGIVGNPILSSTKSIGFNSYKLSMKDDGSAPSSLPALDIQQVRDLAQTMDEVLAFVSWWMKADEGAAEEHFVGKSILNEKQVAYETAFRGAHLNMEDSYFFEVITAKEKGTFAPENAMHDLIHHLANVVPAIERWIQRSTD